MKLRNRKTGEIIDLSKGSITDVGFGTSIQLQATDRYNKPIFNYNSLAELNKEWEDYEEPKKHYEILAMGAVMECKDTEDEIFRNLGQREIGNYFETREDAEEAVKKLKAWKRLKDNGFRFEGTYYLGKPFNSFDECEQAMKDLATLIGGEE